MLGETRPQDIIETGRECKKFRWNLAKFYLPRPAGADAPKMGYVVATHLIGIYSPMYSDSEFSGRMF
jgi:hypothetical protein